MKYKVITLDNPMSFHEALKELESGKCLGIRPLGNSRYIELFRPAWKSTGWQLRWNQTEECQAINVDQFLGEWFLVVVDHRDLI